MDTKTIMEMATQISNVAQSSYIEGALQARKDERNRILEIIKECQYADHDPKKEDCCIKCSILNEVIAKI